MSGVAKSEAEWRDYWRREKTTYIEFMNGIRDFLGLDPLPIPNQPRRKRAA